MTQNVLGKGLAALINESKEGLKTADNSPITELNINLIIENPIQPRKSFDQEKLQELATSIEEHGFIQPLVVCEHANNKYMLIAGERRYKAAKILKLQSVPVIVKQVDDQTVQTLALIENIQRENLDPIEEAQAIQLLINKYNCSHEFIAKKLGKSRSYITNALRILHLPQDVISAVKNQNITMAHAKLIANNPNASKHAQKFVEENMSVRKAESYMHAQSYNNNKTKARYKLLNRALDFDVNELERQLSKDCGLKITIRDSSYGSGGTLNIEFITLEQLDYIIQTLCSHIKAI